MLGMGIIMDISIRSMHLSELEFIFGQITEDFAEGEYPPYDKLYKHLKMKKQTGWILVRDGRDEAYCICTGDPDGYVLVTLLATFREFRGNGNGTIFLKKLKELYSDAAAIIVEVERVEDAADEEEAHIRERRVEFYKRSGFNLIPGIDYTIWHIPMHLMALPLKTPFELICKDIEVIIRELYLPLLGEHFIHKMEIAKL